MKHFKSLPSIKFVYTVDNLTYGVGKTDNQYYVFLKKEGQQWVKRHGPFGNPAFAVSYIQQIKDEYNAVKEKRSRQES